MCASGVLSATGAVLLLLAGCTGEVLVPGEDAPVLDGPPANPARPGPGPSDPTNPGAPSDPADPTDPTDPADPTDPTVPTDPGPAVDFSFACDASTVDVPAADTRRLTSDQHRAALRAVLEPRLGSLMSATWTDMRDTLDRVPVDLASLEMDYARMSQAVDQSRVDAWYDAARAAAEAVTRTAERRVAVLGACAETPNTACADAAVRDLGREVFRRDPTEAEVRFLVDQVFSPDVAGWTDLLTTLFTSPPFLYVFELGAPEQSASALRPLAGPELATRLAMHFWGRGPDAALLDAATSGALDDPGSYAQQVRRLARDPRARPAFDRFVSDWLRLWRVPDPAPSSSRADFIAYAGDDLPSATLRDAAVQEVLDLVHHVAFEARGSFADLMRTRLAFPRTIELARLYGLDQTWSEGQPPLELPAERAGLATRVALLLNDQATTRPIIRGVRVRKRFLCDQLRLPENMNDILLEEATGDRSTRQKIADLTLQPGSTCQGCHVTINPPGFALEGFDALGRSRTIEEIFTADGQLAGTHPVDTAVEMPVDGRTLEVSGARELAEALASSAQAEACFARQYVRFALGRREVLPEDGCMLEAVRRQVAEGAPLVEVFEAVALAPSFRWTRKE